MNVASIQDGLKLNRDLHAEVVARWKAYRSDPEEGKFWPLVSFAIKALKTHKCIIALEDQGLGQDVANLGRAFTRPRYALKEIADALNEKYPHVPGTPRYQSTVSRHLRRVRKRDEPLSTKGGADAHAPQRAISWHGTVVRDVDRARRWFDVEGLSADAEIGRATTQT